jgi:hypothetical protein
MPNDPENFRESRETGSEWHAVKVTRLSRNGLAGFFTGPQLTASVVMKWCKSPSGIDLNRRP